jgi:hypothetical protein
MDYILNEESRGEREAEDDSAAATLVVSGAFVRRAYLARPAAR